MYCIVYSLEWISSASATLDLIENISGNIWEVQELQTLLAPASYVIICVCAICWVSPCTNFDVIWSHIWQTSQHASNLSNLCLVTSCSNASKFWEKDKLPLGQSDKKTCILTFWSAHGKLHLLEWDLFAHFRCRIPDEMFAQNEMHLTKKSLWNFPTGRTRRSQKLTHNLCKEQFVHQMRF